MTRLSFRGTLNEADLALATRYAVWNRSLCYKLLFGFGCLLVLFGIIDLVIGQGVDALPPFVLGLLFTFFPFVLPKLSLKRALKANAFLLEEGAYDFDEVQFSVAWPSVQVSMHWTRVHSVVEMKEQFTIFSTKTSFYPIPKRFLFADQIAPFRELLERALQQNGKRLILRGRRA